VFSLEGEGGGGIAYNILLGALKKKKNDRENCFLFHAFENEETVKSK